MRPDAIAEQLLERTIKTCDVNVAAIVSVDVIAPVIVAALGNGNDAVAVIDAVDECATAAAKHYTIARGSAVQAGT